MILFALCLNVEPAMPQISRTALVPFSAEQMYQLVNEEADWRLEVYSAEPRGVQNRVPSRF